MKLEELRQKLFSQLAIADFDDISLNGVQIACSADKEIKKVGLAVDA